MSAENTLWQFRSSQKQPIRANHDGACRGATFRFRLSLPYQTHVKSSGKWLFGWQSAQKMARKRIGLPQKIACQELRRKSDEEKRKQRSVAVPDSRRRQSRCINFAFLGSRRCTIRQKLIHAIALRLCACTATLRCLSFSSSLFLLFFPL